MFLKHLYLHNFRCHKETSFEFCTGINTICGPNAQGKTSILEAIYFLSTGRSFRTSQAADLIRLGADYFYLEASFVKHGIEQKLKISCSSKERKILYNSTQYHSTSSLLGLLPAVVITPDDIALVKGAPLVRRHFLDLQIAQVDPLYVHHLTRYNRAMRQRNALLRTKSTVTLGSWEQEMANAAAYLTLQRFHTTKELQVTSQKRHTALTAEQDKLNLGYRTSSPANSEIEALRHYHLEQFQKLRSREMALGSTLTGPHKDDLAISIGEKEARYFASEGQQRSCLTAMRLAEWERLNSLTNEAPLMLIDDVGISLDGSRRERLLDSLGQLGQVFLAATQELPIHCPEKDHLVLKINGSQEPGVRSQEK